MNFEFPQPFLAQFAEYVYYKDFMMPFEFEKLEALWENGDKQPALVNDGEDKPDLELRNSEIVQFEHEESTKWIYEKMGSFMMQCNGQYYGFDLNGIGENLQIAEYGEGAFFNWHLDFAKGPASYRKLSATIQLSDPQDYEGGDLEFMINDKTITAPRIKGALIIFPSFLMHRVTPITKGVRKSLVAWASGRPYR